MAPINRLSRPLFIYVARKAADRPEVQRFVESYFTAQELLREVGYVELTPQIYDLAKKHFTERRVGTAFGSGESQVGLTLEKLLAREQVGHMKRFEFLIEWGLFLCALLSIGTTIGIIVVLTMETVAFLREVPIAEFLFGTEWTPLFANAALWRPAARGRHDARLAHRDAGGLADGAAQRDLPE